MTLDHKFIKNVLYCNDCSSSSSFFLLDYETESNFVKCRVCQRYRDNSSCHVFYPHVFTHRISKIKLPLLQILCVHLKRFRHELMFSTKISTHVSFPLEGLDLQPFLAKDSSAQTTNYDLLSVICHHGTASSEWAQLLLFPLRPGHPPSVGTQECPAFISL